MSINKLILFIGIILFSVNIASATWANESFLYQANFTVSSSNGFQYNITISNATGTNTDNTIYCNGHCQTNFTDIRAYLNNTTLLSYFWTDLSTGRLSVNVTNSGTLNIYYGNSTIGTLNDSNSTFPTFYNFENITHGFSAGTASTTQKKYDSYSLAAAAGANSKVIPIPAEPFSVSQYVYFSAVAQQTRLWYQRNASHYIPLSTGYCGNNWCYYNGAAWASLGVATATGWNKIEFIVNSNGSYSVFINNALAAGSLTMQANVDTAGKLSYLRDDANALYIDGIYTRTNMTSPVPELSDVCPELSLYSNNYTNNQTLNFSAVKTTSVLFYYNGTVVNWCVDGVCTGTTTPTFTNYFSGSTTPVLITLVGNSFNVTWNVTVLPYSDFIPTLTSPTNGSSITFSYPPQYGDVPFTWSLIGSSGYNMIIASDINFNLVISNHTTSDNFTSHTLESGTYYWKVRTYNTGDIGSYSDVFSFTLSPSSNITVNNSSQGIVYHLVNGQITPISGAKVELYNTTYYTYQVTGDNGYFIFTGLAASTTYNLKASKVDEFDDSPIIPVTIVANASVTTNILMQKCVSVFTCFYNKQWVTFAVQDIYFNRYPNTTITSYKNGELTADDGGETDYSGKITLLMIKNQQYRLELVNVAEGISQTVYIVPGDTFYVLIVTPTQTYFKTPDNENDDLVITPSTYTINATAAYINVSYLNITGHANQVTATVYLSNIDGTNTTVNTTTLTTSNTTFSYLVQPYSGQSYTVKLTIYNDSLGVQYIFNYGFTFQGVPVDPYAGDDTFKGIIAILFIFFVASFFSETTAGIGGIIVSAVAGLMYAMGFMNASWFGAYVPFAIGFGVVISIVYVVSQKNAKEGFS